MSNVETDILLQLLLLPVAQRGQALRPLPKSIAQGLLPSIAICGPLERWVPEIPVTTVQGFSLIRLGRMLTLASISRGERPAGASSRASMILRTSSWVGNRTMNEVVRDLRVFLPAQQHAVRTVKFSPGTSDLLVVGYYRARCLVVDDERQIRLVEAHSQGGCRNQRLYFIVQKFLLQVIAILASRRVSLDRKAARLEPGPQQARPSRTVSA